MFHFRDFTPAALRSPELSANLPQLDDLLAGLAGAPPGLGIVAGLDGRLASAGRLEAAGRAGSRLLPSGRTAFFGLLVNALLDARPSHRALIIAPGKDLVRLPRPLQRRCEYALVNPPYTYAGRIAEAIQRRPDLIVLDHLDPLTAPLALQAAAERLRVIAQLDTPFAGEGVARHLLDLGADPATLSGLRWVLAIQRLPALCPRCRQPIAPAELDPALIAAPGGATYYRAAGCEHCHNGRRGDVALFDFYQPAPSPAARAEDLQLLPEVEDLAPQPATTPSGDGDSAKPVTTPSGDGESGTTRLPDHPTTRLSMHSYARALAAAGLLSLDDFLNFEHDQFHRTFNVLAASERALLDANLEVQRRLAELEAANRVLQQRTQALISLQELSSVLISSGDLAGLAAHVCRRSSELCGAERSMLYLWRSPQEVEVLAVHGWQKTLVGQRLPAPPHFLAIQGSRPVAHMRRPPGAPPAYQDGELLRVGLAVPLVAQERQVGLLIVHAGHKERFTPGETALLQSFANQAAAAIQRAGLIEQLQERLSQLQAAQAGLRRKERLEHEMALARQVQQSVLPRTFPRLAGLDFAAQNEPARQVGGDFYDVIVLDEDHIGLAVADVADKGFAAALYMGLTRSLLHAEAQRERSPRQVAANVNRLLQELGEVGLFVTLFYGVLARTPSGWRMTYVRAGHDRPLLARAGQVNELPFDPSRDHGAALGILPESDLHLAEESLDLLPGDRLLLYTDGLIDSLSPAGEAFGCRRLHELFARLSSQTADALCRALFAELEHFRGPAAQFDDMTALIVSLS